MISIYLVLVQVDIFVISSHSFHFYKMLLFIYNDLTPLSLCSETYSMILTFHYHFRDLLFFNLILPYLKLLIYIFPTKHQSFNV